MISAGVLRQLRMIDWDFPSTTEGCSVSLHWYPGTFTASLPAALIQTLSEPGDVVVDPFAGIGTTGVEALRLGRNTLLFELNPIARATAIVSAGLVLLRRSDPGTLKALFNYLSAELDACFPSKQDRISLLPLHPSPPGELPALGALETLRELTSADADERELARWFAPGTLKAVLRLRQRAAGDMPAFAALCLWVMLSDRLRSLSSQTRSWGHVADCVLPKEADFKEKDVGAACRRWLTLTRRSIDQIALESARISCSAVVTDADWSKVPSTNLAQGQADLMITSPPYGGAIDYVRSQRLSLYLAGRSPEDVSRLGGHEIGARRKRFSRAGRESWAPELEAAFQRQLPLVKDNGLLALVLPTDDSAREPAVDMVLNSVSKLGWKSEFEAVRSIRTVKARHAWTSIRRELVVVYSREGG